MRKWFFAGAVAGGFLLLGAVPAQADVVPALAGGPLSSIGGDQGPGLEAIPGGPLGVGMLGGGLLPDGRTVPAEAPRESALFGGGLPLLGGLGGLLPANEVPDTVLDDDLAGLPAGGTAVDPALVDPAQVDPTLVDPTLVDDPRVPEEPAADEAGGRRSFSDGGRPIAGEDQDFR